MERAGARLAERIVMADLPPFTVSVGLATSEQAGDFDLVVSLADAALLRAKAGGRDRIVVSSGADRPVAEANGQVEPALPAGGDARVVSLREPQHN